MATFPTYVKLAWRDTGESPRPIVARTEMERGLPKQRRIAADTVVTVPLTCFFDTKADAVAFETWVYTTLDGGMGWFNWTNPRTGTTVSARIVGGDIGTLQPENKTWVYARRSFKIEYVRAAL